MHTPTGLMSLTAEERFLLVSRALSRGPMEHYRVRLAGEPEKQAHLKSILLTATPKHVHDVVAAENCHRPSLGRKDAVKAA